METVLAILLVVSTATNVVLGFEVLSLRNEVSALRGEIKGLSTSKGGN